MKNIFTVLLILLIAGCNVESPDKLPNDMDDPKLEDGGEKEVVEKGKVSLSDLKLQKYQSCEDMKAYITKSLIKRFTEFNYYTNRRTFMADDAVPEASVAASDGGGASALTASADSEVLTGVSETNNQEEGVDEPDVVKTDSKGNIYVVHGTKLIISNGFPPSEMKTVATVELGSYLRGLHIDEQNNRLVLSGNYYSNDATDEIRPNMNSYGIKVVFFDIQDLENPSIMREIFIEGSETGSRRIEDRIHLVSSFNRDLPESLIENKVFWDLLWKYRRMGAEDAPIGISVSTPMTVTAEPLSALSALDLPGMRAPRVMLRAAEMEKEVILEMLKSMITDAVNDSDITDFFPKSFEKIEGSWNKINALSCSDVFSPNVSMTPGLLVVTSFDTDGQQMKSTAVVNNAWQIYSSKESLYVLQSSRGWWFNSAQRNQSAVYKFNISGEAPRYSSAGTFSGWINDQFSVSEHDGHLRVVTTSSDIDEDTGVNQSVNNLFVLKENDTQELGIVGKVTGLAPGERVYSARFLGDKGFVVTFRNVDPLFSFDLSDPENPQLTGELKIPGFSTYMYPISDTHLLTIGREGSMLQLQLFDVSDLSSPKLVHKEIPDANDLSGKYRYTYSSAQYDHHAFTYYGPEKILVFPYSYSWYGDKRRHQYFNGFLSYRVDVEEGFKELGRVDHSDLAWQKYCETKSSESFTSPYICQDQSYTYYGNPRRSIIMTTEEQTYLYSLSNVGLKATPIDAPENVLGSIIFPGQRYGWWWWAY